MKRRCPLCALFVLPSSVSRGLSQLKTENWKLKTRQNVGSCWTKKIDSQNYVMVLDIIELFTSCVQLSLCIFTKKKINFRQSIAWYTVFPRIVFATTILFWRLRVRQLFKGDNYSREETIDFLLFVCLYSLISSKLFSFNSTETNWLLFSNYILQLENIVKIRQPNWKTLLRLATFNYLCYN